jgi:hypothetical protein
MSVRRVGRPTWPARLGAIAGLVAFCAAPIVVYVLAGRFPSFPRLTTWAAFRDFLSHADDAAFGDAVLRWAERVGVVLYLWLATELVITLGAQLAGRLGRSSLRSDLESLQPRSVAVALNAVVIAALSIAPRAGTGVAVASTSVTAPERPDPAGGGAPPPAPPGTPTAETQTAQREHVVHPGESLWSIAAAECASPLYWRDIADLNGIEHPALIPPGWCCASRQAARSRSTWPTSWPRATPSAGSPSAITGLRERGRPSGRPTGDRSCPTAAPSATPP